MNARPIHDGDASGGRFLEPIPGDLAIGQIEHDCRTAIRDLIRVEGFEQARQFVAFALIDEADGRPDRG